MNVIKLFSALSGLSSVHRYSQRKLVERESVLEHLGWVSFVSMLLAHELETLGVDVDFRQLMTKALIHDVDELVTGDIPRPTKYHSEETKKLFKKMARMGVDKVIGDVGLNSDVHLWLVAAHTDSKSDLEGLIVAIADAMAVAYKVWEEVIVRSNMSMVRQAVTVRDQFSILIDRVIDYKWPKDDLRPASFFREILEYCSGLMWHAASKEDPIHGAFREEMKS